MEMLSKKEIGAAKVILGAISFVSCPFRKRLWPEKGLSKPGKTHANALERYE
jgi:hypothetical protein